MIVSFKNQKINFNEYHSLSTDKDRLVFHGIDKEKSLLLSEIESDDVDSLCNVIAEQYGQGKKEVKLEHFIQAKEY